MIDAELIKKLATCIGYEFNQEGSKPSVVVVGEIHHDPIGCCCQEVLVAMLKPEYVLIEILHAVSYDTEKDCIELRESTKVGQDDLDELEGFKKESDNFYKQMSQKYNIKLIGCDLSMEEQHGLMEELGLYPYGNKSQDSDDTRINDARENKMGEIIFDHSRKSSEPLIAVIGYSHAKKSSKIHEKLKEHYIDYICIWSKKAVEYERKYKP